MSYVTSTFNYYKVFIDRRNQVETRISLTSTVQIIECSIGKALKEANIFKINSKWESIIYKCEVILSYKKTRLSVVKWKAY